jgi:hypothetical protein
MNGWGKWDYYNEEHQRRQDEAAGALDASARQELARRVRITEAALLIAHPPTSPVGTAGRVRCCWCEGEGWGRGDIDHTGDCPWDTARALVLGEGE